MKTNHGTAPKSIVSAALLAGCLLVPLSPSTAANVAPLAATTATSNANSVYDSFSEWQGVTHAELAQQWTQWFYSIPLHVNPIQDTTGIQCGINQQGPIWFIEGPIPPSAPATNTLQCNIPYGKAIFGGVFAYVNDYPCPEPPPFEPGTTPPQTLADFLTEGANGYINLLTNYGAELDGKRLKLYRVTSGLFPFTAAIDLQAVDPCVTGSPELGVTAGYFFAIDSLSPGTHTLHIHFVPPGGALVNNTFKLTIMNK